MSNSGQTGIYFDSGGHRLLGTLFLAKGDNPKPTAVLLHGVPGIEKNYDLALDLRERSWNSLIFHYRGCWGSSGVYTLKTIQDDVRSALDYLCNGVHPQIDPEKLVLIGHSLGGWAAVLAAANDPRPKAVAIYGAVCDPRDLNWAEETAGIVERDFVPWLPGLTAQAFREQWAALDKEYNPVEQVGRLAPRLLLVIYGSNDDVVPPFQSVKLHAQAGNISKLLIHPEADHAFTWHRAWLRDRVIDWLHGLDL